MSILQKKDILSPVAQINVLKTSFISSNNIQLTGQLKGVRIWKQFQNEKQAKQKVAKQR